MSRCEECESKIKKGEEFQKIKNDKIIILCLNCFLQDMDSQIKNFDQAFASIGL